MLLNTATMVLAVLGTAINAQILADRIPNKRTALPAGGWALTAPGGTCPAGAPVCDSGWCCPGSLTCIEGGNADQDNYCCAGCECFSCPLLLCFDFLSFARPSTPLFITEFRRRIDSVI
jgi:hypothetical protein